MRNEMLLVLLGRSDISPFERSKLILQLQSLYDFEAADIQTIRDSITDEELQRAFDDVFSEH